MIASFIERVICAVLGHNYMVERFINPRTRKVGCTRCHRHWAMHDATQTFIEWDSEFDALYPVSRK
jgi:hypothetical protein